MTGIPGYNTALQGGTQHRAPPLQRHEGVHGVSFAWDLAHGIPPEMADGVDVFYAEPPWPHGFAKFAEMAKRPQGLKTHGELLDRIGTDLRRIGKPAVVVTGTHGVARLKPDVHFPARLNGGDAIACLWGLSLPAHKRDMVDILQEIATGFKVVGDFCCGYGRAGWAFVQTGGRYIMSDFDPHCIGQIARTEAEWGR